MQKVLHSMFFQFLFTNPAPAPNPDPKTEVPAPKVDAPVCVQLTLKEQIEEAKKSLLSYKCKKWMNMFRK